MGQVLDRNRPDLMIITGWQSLSLLQTLFACRKRQIPVIARGESTSLKPRPVWVRTTHRFLLSRFDAFLAIGKSNRTFYLKNGVNPRRIFAAPYFIDNDMFLEMSRKHGPDRDEIRRSWGITPESVCFLFAGKLVLKKRPLDLLRAFAHAIDIVPRIHLLMVGSGAEGARAREFAAREQLPVTFTGFLNQTEMGRAYTAADCLVLPSDYGETWGLVVNEAMVSRKPAIVSDRVGCGPDLIIEGETGWTVPFGNIQALAQRLVQAAEKPAKLVQMGERARVRVLAGYSVGRTVEATIRAARFVVESSTAATKR